MQGRPRSVLLGGSALVMLAGVAFVVQQHSSEPAPVPRVPPASVSDVVLGRTVHVESGVPSTRFLPLGSAPRDGRTLSAQHAYNALVQDPSKLYPIPGTVRAYYGLLTDASASPMAVHTRVWAFAVESGCTSTSGPPRSDASGLSARTHCRLWEFVDARTGHDLGLISQQVLPD